MPVSILSFTYARFPAAHVGVIVPVVVVTAPAALFVILTVLTAVHEGAFGVAVDVQLQYGVRMAAWVESQVPEVLHWESTE